jgi:hypothetical protein
LISPGEIIPHYPTTDNENPTSILLAAVAAETKKVVAAVRVLREEGHDFMAADGQKTAMRGGGGKEKVWGTRDEG